MNIRLSFCRSTLCGILCLVTAAALAFALVFQPAPIAQAARPASPMLVDPIENPQDPAAWRFFGGCTIAYIRVDERSVQVSCTDTYPGAVNVFVIPNDAAHRDAANRILVIANMAYALDRSVTIIYDDDPAAVPPGYSIINSRALVGIIINYSI